MILDNLLGLAAEAEGDAEAYEVAAREAVRALVAPKGKVEPALLEREQFAAHGFAWSPPMSRRCARCGAGPRAAANREMGESSSC